MKLVTQKQVNRRTDTAFPGGLDHCLEEDKADMLAISCRIRVDHHCTTPAFTGLLSQHVIHEAHEQSNPHTDPSFVHTSN